MAISTFIPTLWSARLLAHLDKSLVLGNLVNRDYEGEIKNFGDRVKINQIADVTVKDYIKGTDITYDAADGRQVVETLSWVAPRCTFKDKKNPRRA
ncbi:MAG: hypothetical protein SPL36_04725 [Succiniclasticum sp.]|nr:hypothetical protein [Succiniclasticum sp.]